MKLMEKKWFRAFIKVLSYIASILYPIIGFGMWFVNRKSNPKLAKIYLILMVVGFFVNLFGITWLENYTGQSLV